MSERVASSVIELVGPAGSGKTTVVSCMAAQPDVHVVSSVGLAESWAQQCAAAARAAPRIARTVAGGRTSTRQVAWIARLMALAALSRRPGNDVLVLDQGPLYTLSRLRAARPALGDDRWNTRQITNWARLLDVVVVLDAADHELVARIRARDKDHVVKAASHDEAMAAVARQRAELEHVVAASAAHGLEVLRFRTDDLAVEQIADRVLAASRRATGIRKSRMEQS